MKILLIEDDSNKAHEIESYLVNQGIIVDTEKSYNAGLRKIIDNNNNIQAVLLDMNVPTFNIDSNSTGGRRRMYGGKDILWQMSRRLISLPTLIITQFDWFDDGDRQFTLEELTGELKKIPNINFLGSIFYSPASEDWKCKLKESLQNISDHDTRDKK
jgi:CheY-like chemotaxis protein